MSCFFIIQARRLIICHYQLRPWHNSIQHSASLSGTPRWKEIEWRMWDWPISSTSSENNKNELLQNQNLNHKEFQKSNTTPRAYILCSFPLGQCFRKDIKTWKSYEYKYINLQYYLHSKIHFASLKTLTTAFL